MYHCIKALDVWRIYIKTSCLVNTIMSIRRVWTDTRAALHITIILITVQVQAELKHNKRQRKIISSQLSKLQSNLMIYIANLQIYKQPHTARDTPLDLYLID
jgi:hypothetical protein